MAMVLAKKEVEAIQKVLNKHFGCDLEVNGSMDAKTSSALRLHIGASRYEIFPPASLEGLHPKIRDLVKQELAPAPAPKSVAKETTKTSSKKADPYVATPKPLLDVEESAPTETDAPVAEATEAGSESA